MKIYRRDGSLAFETNTALTLREAVMEAVRAHANLSGANLFRANLSGANLSDADLFGADLSGADLSGANLFRANLSRANLSRANLRRADLFSAYLSDANLSGANLFDANLSDADLFGANLRRADLSRANLRRANLSDADPSGAYLFGANLRHANLSGAYLSGANLSGAYLSGAKGLDCWRTTPLALLLDQPGPIRAYKLVNAAGEGPFNGGVKYELGAQVEETSADTSDAQCAAGINLASLDWCIREWRHGYRILVCEFTAADIASIPAGTDGKFRVFRCTPVAEKDLSALGLVP